MIQCSARYAISSYFGSIIGSYLESSNGKTYEVLGFFSGGTSATIYSYLLDRHHDFNQGIREAILIRQIFIHTIATFVDLFIKFDELMPEAFFGRLISKTTSKLNEKMLTFFNTLTIYLISHAFI